MSATLRISDMAGNKTLFATPPPTINVPGRQHPVTVHFSRRTKQDYVAEAIRKATKIHNRLPPGGVLIFLTGQNEIAGVCRKLEARFGPKVLSEKKRKRSTISKLQRASGDAAFTSPTAISANQGDLEAEDMDFGVDRGELAIDVDDDVMDTDEHGSDREALDSDGEEENGMEDNWDDVGSEDSQLPLPSAFLPNNTLQYRCTSCRCTLCFQGRNKARCLNPHPKDLDLWWWLQTLQKPHSQFRASVTWWTVEGQKR